MTQNTVTAVSVSKSFGAQRALDGVSLVLRRGERVALVGHNGAGKSTLIKLILGLTRPTSGRVEVLGADPAARAAARVRASLGFLPESVVFHPAMTGAELMAFYARLKRQPVSRTLKLLERVGIADAAHRRVGTYSKGMRQRLGLAQALIGRPELLLLDEPTTGLDPASRQNLYGIVGELSREGATVLLSSHALAEIEQHADRVAMLSRGRKVADGTLSDLRRSAGNPARIRVRLPQGVAVRPPALGDDAVWRQVGAQEAEILCPDGDKLVVLHRLLAAGLPIEDIEIVPPSLDEIYAGTIRREAAE